MNKFLSASVLAVALTLSAGTSMAAGFNEPQNLGGFQGPGLTTSTVAQALSYSDDTPVVLEGKIERSLGDEKYLFKDASGTVTIDIDHEDWRGINVTPKDTVVIQGEVDKDFFKTEIDVDMINLKK